MKITDDNQMNEIAIKLGNLQENLMTSKDEGLKTVEIHKQVMSHLVEDKDEAANDMINAFKDATKELVEKTYVQLESMDIRIEAGKKLLEAIKDKENLELIVTMLIFIGAEQPQTKTLEA